jgi:CheY-like chemotaxis protein
VQPSWVELLDKTKNLMESFTLAACEDKVAFSRCGLLQVTISDTGVGMSEDQVAKLFRDGVQYNSNRLQAGQGSGLGLFIAKGIMKRHDGNLTADSDGLAQGTAFTLTLPVYSIPDGHPSLCREEHASPSENNNDHAIRADAAPAQQQQAPARNLRVLVVDDAKINRKLLSKLLERQGHACDQAEDGVQAIKKVTEALESGEPFESILLDYEMPIMDGPTAAQKIRQMEGFDSFIVGITGNVLPEDVAYFKKCGADDVLPKPLDLPALAKLWEEAGVLS